MNQRSPAVFERLRAARLPWSFFISSVIHSVLLAWILYSWNHPQKPLSNLTVRLADEAPTIDSKTESQPDQPKSPPENTKRRPVSSNRFASPQVKSAPNPSAGRQPSGAAETSAPTGEAPPGQAGIITDPAGIPVGGIQSSGGSTATSSGTGTGSGTGTIGTASRKSASQSVYGPPPGAPDPTVIAIPPTVRGATASFQGAIYAEAERYVLHGPDLRTGIAVPANDLFIDGNIVRTVYRTKQTQKITNMAQCTSRNVGDDDVWICPREAETLAVVFDGYLASPVNYAINSCLQYDKSTCSHYLDGESQAETCRQPVKYEGIWAANTQFQYRCVKAEVRKHSHSLQYQVRFLQDVEVIANRLVKKVLASETRQIPRCQ